jgi:integrase/recombinase XerD
LRRSKEADKEKNTSGLDELVAAMAQHLEARKLSPSTVSGRLVGLGRFRQYVKRIGITDVREMGRAQVDRYVAELRDSGLAPRTVENWIAALKSFFRFLVETNRLLLSPAEHLRERNLGHLVGPTVTVAEADKVLAAVNTSTLLGIRDRTMLELIYGTGIRRGECATMTIFDVDVDGGQLRVLGKRGERMVPLGKVATKWLRTYLGKVRSVLMRRRMAQPECPLVFLGKSGQPLSDQAVHVIVRQAGQHVGVKLSCQRLRRTMATEMLRGGAGVREVGAVLGHKRLETTQKYTKVLITDLRKVHAERHPRGR